MPLDNRLQRKKLSSDTYKDDMSAGKEESPLNNIIPVLPRSCHPYSR